MSLSDQAHGFSPSTPIDRVITILARRMGLEDSYDYKIDKYIKLLKDAWIASFGTLLRLPPGFLEKLGLPLALRYELETLRELPNNFKDVQYIYVESSAVQDKRYVLQIPDRHKELVLSSFRNVTRFKNQNGQTGMQIFETRFFPFFFEHNPAAQRLFDVNHLSKQSKAFVRMMYWIVENIDNSNLEKVLSQLGGRHIIYGVSESEYALFAKSVALCFGEILGPKLFTTEMANAWEATLISLSELMVAAGEITKKGFQGEVKGLRENGVWNYKYCTLALDSLYLYRDKSRKDLYGQFPLRDVTIQFPKDTNGNVLHQFQLSSFNPPFLLTLAALDGKELNVWMTELDWRILALQRVYKDYESETSESLLSFDDNDVKGSAGESLDSTDRENKVTKMKITKRQKRRKEGPSDGLEEDKEHMEALLRKGLILSRSDKDIIRNSWSYITTKKVSEGGMTKSGIGILFELFYAKFFEADPTGKRLFENSGLKTQGRALVQMIGMIVRALDDFAAFTLQIQRLGGRHNIYGVKAKDYQVFGDILSMTISDVSDGGEGLIKKEVKDAWSQSTCRDDDHRICGCSRTSSRGLL